MYRWGGKRKGAGRGKDSDRDWNKYKDDAKKKKLSDASKSSGDIKKMFFKQSEKKQVVKEERFVEKPLEGLKVLENILIKSEPDVNTDSVDIVNKIVDNAELFFATCKEVKSALDAHLATDEEGNTATNPTIQNENLVAEEINLDLQGDNVGLMKAENAESHHEKADLDEFITNTVGGDDLDNSMLGSEVLEDFSRTNVLKIQGLLPSPLPYLVNGCFDPCVHGSNYTCAPDTIYSVIEAVVLSDGGEIWQDKRDQLLVSALDMVKWRLDNNFSSCHELRKVFWETLCQLFPRDMLPKGRVSAALDSAIDYLSTKAPIEVVFSAECLKCGGNMGWFKYKWEGPLVITTTNLKTIPKSLAEICLALISVQLKHLLCPGPQRVKCDDCGAWGAKTPKITISNLLLPPVLILGFLLMARGAQTVSCKIEENIILGDSKYFLTAAVITKPNHFVAISKLMGRFYNMDNLDQIAGKKGFSSFREALINKETMQKEEVILDKRSPDCRRAGAVHYSVYVGGKESAGNDYKQFSNQAMDINTLLGKQPEHILLQKSNENLFGRMDVDSEEAQSLAMTGKESFDFLLERKVSEPDLTLDEKSDPGLTRREDLNMAQGRHADKTLDELPEVELTLAGRTEAGLDLRAEQDKEDQSGSESELEYLIEDDGIEDIGSEVDDEVFESQCLDNLSRLDDEPVNIDLRLRTFQDMGRLCRLYPGAYYDHDRNGWFCRKCQAFAFPSSASNPWISTGVSLGDHPSRKMKSHFRSDLHKKSIEAEQHFKRPSVHAILCASGKESEKKKEIENRNILKSMFTIALHMVKHCLPNDGFEDMVKLVANAGSSEMKKYLSECPKNATYLSRQSYRELLETMNNYIETPILEAARSQLFTIFIDETTAVGNISMANVYIMFDEDTGVNEHYLGIVNMNHGLGLTAKHFYNAAVELCTQKGISLSDCVFSDMDGCATNQGRIKGLKLYWIFHNPHHISETCGSHKLALLPQKLVVEGRFEPLQEADKLAVGLAVYFKGSSLRTAIFENTQTILENKVLKLVVPSPTRWLTHGKCFERLIKLFLPTLETLNSLYTDKQDFKALGFMLGMIQPSFQLSCLALHDVFKVMSLLTHWLQTNPANADITRVPVLVKITVNKLLYLAGDDTKKNTMTNEDLESLKFTVEEFEELSSKIDQFVMSTPIAGSSRRRRDASLSSDKQAVFNDFQDDVFKTFAKEMAENIEESLNIDPICRAFACLDIRNFPNSGKELDTFGEEDLEKLTSWYGVTRKGVFPNEEEAEEQISTVDPIVNTAETKLEYKTYKDVLKLEKHKFEKANKKSVEECERKLSVIKQSRNSGRDKRQIISLEKQIKNLRKKELTLRDVYLLLLKPEIGITMPNIKKLLLLANLSPVGNAIVERLFSLMKLTKTFLRNRLGDQNLDILLRLNKEAPETWTDEQKEDLVELWVERRESKGQETRWKI